MIEITYQLFQPVDILRWCGNYHTWRVRWNRETHKAHGLLWRLLGSDESSGFHYFLSRALLRMINAFDQIPQANECLAVSVPFASICPGQVSRVHARVAPRSPAVFPTPFARGQIPFLVPLHRPSARLRKHKGHDANHGEHSHSDNNPLPHTSFIGTFLRSFAAKQFVSFVLIRVSSSSVPLCLRGSPL